MYFWNTSYKEKFAKFCVFLLLSLSYIFHTPNICFLDYKISKFNKDKNLTYRVIHSKITTVRYFKTDINIWVTRLLS